MDSELRLFCFAAFLLLVQTDRTKIMMAVVKLLLVMLVRLVLLPGFGPSCEICGHAYVNGQMDGQYHDRYANHRRGCRLVIRYSLVSLVCNINIL